MKRNTYLVLIAVTLGAIAGCASTDFTSTWKAADAMALDPRGHKIAAVYISSDEAGRRIAEDVLVRKLAEHGAQGIAAYTLIPSSELGNMSFVEKLRSETLR